MSFWFILKNYTSSHKIAYLVYVRWGTGPLQTAATPPGAVKFSFLKENVSISISWDNRQQTKAKIVID